MAYCGSNTMEENEKVCCGGFKAPENEDGSIPVVLIYEYAIDKKNVWNKMKSICSIVKAQIQNLFKPTTWWAILLGQVMALFMPLSSFATVQFIEVYNIRIPNAQNFIVYLVLTMVFTTPLMFRPGERNILSILITRGWKYAFVGLINVEANYLIFKSYQYTTWISVHLLDCFAIPIVLLLSWRILMIRFKVPHILGVCLSLVGISCLLRVVTEETIMRPRITARERFLGDMICLSGAFLCGLSNIAEELLVKTFDAVEFLGMIGLFGSLFSGAQAYLLEYNVICEIDWSMSSYTTPSSLLITFVFSQLVVIILAASVIKYSSATFLNLSLLTADFYTLMLGVYIHRVKFHALYLLSYALVLSGVVTFSIKKTRLGSQVLSSLTREYTTLLDLELMACTPTTPDDHKSVHVESESCRVERTDSTKRLKRVTYRKGLYGEITIKKEATDTGS